MALPKYRLSKSRTRRRRSINMKLAAPHLIECSSCGNKILTHRICPKCGYYRGKQIIELE
ncbi:MAG: 50S ribosomal protein L32 [Spirochaetales bacterium]|nr:MAG: 50S ribosomal protein L32 [Spirochaetales bacterium]